MHWCFLFQVVLLELCPCSGVGDTRASSRGKQHSVTTLLPTTSLPMASVPKSNSAADERSQRSGRGSLSNRVAAQADFVTIENPFLHLCYAIPLSIIFGFLMYLHRHSRPPHGHWVSPYPIIVPERIECRPKLGLTAEVLDQRCPVQIFGACTNEFNGQDACDGEEYVCAICLVALAVGDEVRALSCPANHSFHAACVDAWLLRPSFTMSVSCPLCRHSLAGPEDCIAAI